MSARTFDTSSELRLVFTKEFERWKRRHGGGLDDLARKIGVSPSYLSHLGRYGRVPGKPVLILLALTFEMENPEALFLAARIDEEWPYEEGARISMGVQNDGGFLQLKLDMKSFTESIRGIVQSEMRPKTIHRLTRGRPLVVGLNHFQQVLIADPENPNDCGRGFFVEFCNLLALTLRCQVTTVEVPFTESREELRAGRIDLFGPKLVRPQSYGELVSDPICRVGHSAIVRRNPLKPLESLPAPDSLSDMTARPYEIGVLKNSGSHLFCNIVLRRNDENLVLCDSVEELFERTTLTGISRPVHLSILNTPTAVSLTRKYPVQLALAFGAGDSLLEMSDNCLLVRPDWPELVPMLNQSIRYLVRTKALEKLIRSWFDAEMPGAVLAAQ